MSFELTKESRSRIATLVKRYPTKRAAALPVLHVVQDQHGFVPEEAEQVVADALEIPVVKIREVLSFYTMYHRKAVGKKHFQMCRTTSCWMRGAGDMIKHLEERLQIRDGQSTEDMKFTLTEVECLGACELAPMMQLNDDYVAHLTTEKLDEIIDGTE